jgi:formimidoylglutamate deiminase
MTAAEAQRLAASGAVAGLCPTTEANLGDGFFPMTDYALAGGAWGIGSDSHVSISPVEELRWLEYGQRLLMQRRNLATSGRAGSTGSALWRSALAGGAAALGRRIGLLAPGYRADLVVLADDAPALCGRSQDSLLDTLIFAGRDQLIRDVMVGGNWVVQEGRHGSEEAVFAAYRAAIGRLAA